MRDTAEIMQRQGTVTLLESITTAATKRPGTAVAYRLSLAPFTRLLGPNHVGDLTVQAIEKFVGERVKDVSPQTVNKELRTLRAALRYAEKRGYILRAPAFADAWCKIDQKTPVCLTVDVQQQLLAAVDNEKFAPRAASRDWWRVFILLVRETGARRGELLGLTWDRLDEVGKVIKISAETSKGRKDRTLYLPDAADLWGILTTWHDQIGGERVLPWDKPTYRQFYTDWQRLRAAAGVVGVVPKNLRSTTGSEMVAAGVPTLAVKDWLGHSSVVTTERYYCNTYAAVRKAAGQRAKWRAGNS